MAATITIAIAPAMPHARSLQRGARKPSACSERRASPGSSPTSSASATTYATSWLSSAGHVSVVGLRRSERRANPNASRNAAENVKDPNSAASTPNATSADFHQRKASGGQSVGESGERTEVEVFTTDVGIESE